MTELAQTILREFGQSGRQITPAEVADMVGEPEPAVVRELYALGRRGLFALVEDGDGGSIQLLAATCVRRCRAATRKPFP